ncbi:MAG: SBBP repeat-containing protein, partial [bacterium]|nr:SBBP repeat-containing protein [bacterium]
MNWRLATATGMVFLLLLPLTPVKAIVGLDWSVRELDPYHADALPIGVLTDSLGNVFVAGHGFHNDSTGYDYLAIKYAPDGSLLWRFYYSGSVEWSWEAPTDMALDPQGNLYLTGFTAGTGYDDMTTICINPQGQLLWEATYNGPDNRTDIAQAIAVDASGNCYVTGYSNNSQGRSRYVSIKYNNLGVQQWLVEFIAPGTAEAQPVDIAVDGMGNVYVTGFSDVDPGTNTNYDYTTIKYNSSGQQQWLSNYNGPSNQFDYPRAMALDENANLYVTGYSEAITQSDCITIKYSASGTRLWVHRFGGTATIDYYAEDLKLDPQGNILIVGNQQDSNYTFKFVTFKLNSSGTMQWVRYYQQTSSWGNKARALVVDDDSNVYASGQSYQLNGGIGCTTIKYDSEGNMKWLAIYDQDDLNLEEGIDVTLDRQGNVIATAGFMFVDQAEYDFLTIKYNQLQGDVAVGMIPTVSPIVIPANGGSFSYHLTTVNGVRNPLPTDLWWQIIYPGASPIVYFSPPQHRDLPLDSCTTLRNQTVSASAPAGTYQYIAYVGDYRGVVWAADTLTFQKLPG